MYYPRSSPTRGRSFVGQQLLLCGAAHLPGAVLDNAEQEQTALITGRVAAGHGEVDELLAEGQQLLDMSG